MRFRCLILLYVLCFFIVIFTFTAEAQETFSASGKVIDMNGAPVQGAQVAIENMGFKTFTSTQTDANGDFSFTNVYAGTNVAKVLTTYTDKTGTTYRVPPEFSQWFAAEGNVIINTSNTMLTDYPPSTPIVRAVGPTIMPSLSFNTPINRSALTVALLLGIVLLAGTYLFLRKVI